MLLRSLTPGSPKPSTFSELSSSAQWEDYGPLGFLAVKDLVQDVQEGDQQVTLLSIFEFLHVNVCSNYLHDVVSAAF